VKHHDLILFSGLRSRVTISVYANGLFAFPACAHVRAYQPFCKKSLHPSPGGHKMMSMSWFSVKTLLKTSLHLAFTDVLIIRNEIAKYASVNFPVFKSLHP